MQEGKMQELAEMNRNSESLFQLKRSDSSTSGSIEVNFSPIPLDSTCTTSLDVEKVVVKSFPIFNTDRRFYTPCFILEVDKSRYSQNHSIYYELHEKKKEELCEEKTIMFLPKPSKNTSFCCICKVFYEDYLTHITHPEHKKVLCDSKFTSEISNLCSLFESRKQNNFTDTTQPKTNGKQKKIKKTNTEAKSNKQVRDKTSKKSGK